MTDTTKRFKRQLPRNSFFQVLSFILQVGIGIWLVPYLVKHLGRAAYGLIPIAGIMTQYVSLISHSISNAVNRFLTIALQQDDTEEANRIFNTAFFSFLALGMLQIPIFVLIIYYANTIFAIPEELYQDAIILLTCSAASFVLNLVCSVFAVPIYANNRLDIVRGIDIGRQFLRLTGIVSFFVISGPALRYIGYVDAGTAIVICIAYAVTGRRLAPALKVTIKDYDWHKVGQLMSMGGWLLVSHVGFLLFMRVDIWLCNRFVSAEAAGDYAAVSQWAALIRHGGTTVSAIIAPMVIIYYAKSEIAQLTHLSKVAVRILSLVLAVPIATICVLSPSLLSLWLGEPFRRLAPLMVIMLCHLGVNVGVMPLFSTQMAMNRVKWPGLVTLVMGVINLVFAIILTRYCGFGIYGVAIAGAIVLTAKNALFTPVYAAVILRHPWHTFLKSYLSGVGMLVGLMALGYAVSHYVETASFVHLFLFSAGMGSVGISAVWVVLPKSDRQLVVDLVPSRFRRMVAWVVPA